MIPARRRLVGAAREFFDREVGSLFDWDRVAFDAAEPMPPLENGRKSPLGKYRERVVMRFGDFVLDVCSSEVTPPLGKIKLFSRERLALEGPLESTVWKQAGHFIKEQCDGG